MSDLSDFPAITCPRCNESVRIRIYDRGFKYFKCQCAEIGFGNHSEAPKNADDWLIEVEDDERRHALIEAEERKAKIDSLPTFDLADFVEDPIGLEVVRAVFHAVYDSGLHQVGDWKKYDPDLCRIKEGETVYLVANSFLRDMRDFYWCLLRLPVLARPWIVCVILQKFDQAFPDWRRRAPF